jgi:hypothetical protein
VSFAVPSHSFHKHPGGIFTRPGDYFIAYPKGCFLQATCSNFLSPGHYDSSREVLKAAKVILKINFLALLQQLRLGAS